MSAVLWQVGYGTNVEIAGLTPAAAEIWFDTTLKALTVGDGVTPGGNYVLMANGGTLTAGTVDNGTINNSHVSGTLTMNALAVIAGTVKMTSLGSGTVTATSGTLSTTSDERLKTVLERVRTGLAAVIALSPVRYTWNEKSGLPTDVEKIGFLAQEVRDLIPGAVTADAKGILHLDTIPIIAALVNGMKELAAKIERLEERLGDR